MDVWWSRDDDGVHALVAGRVHSLRIPSQLLEAHVTGVNPDHQGNLWVRTAGAGVIKARDGRFERYTVRDGLPTDRPDGLFHQDRNGAIWFLESFRHVYRIRHGAHDRVDFPGAPVSGARSFYVDSEAAVWIGTTASLHRVRDRAITLHSTLDGLSLRIAYSLLEDRTGAVWIGNDGPLLRYSDGRLTAVGPDTVCRLDPSAPSTKTDAAVSGSAWQATGSDTCMTAGSYGLLTPMVICRERCLRYTRTAQGYSGSPPQPDLCGCATVGSPRTRPRMDCPTIES